MGPSSNLPQAAISPAVLVFLSVIQKPLAFGKEWRMESFMARGPEPEILQTRSKLYQGCLDVEWERAVDILFMYS